MLFYLTVFFIHQFRTEFHFILAKNWVKLVAVPHNWRRFEKNILITSNHLFGQLGARGKFNKKCNRKCVGMFNYTLRICYDNHWNYLHGKMIKYFGFEKQKLAKFSGNFESKTWQIMYKMSMFRKVFLLPPLINYFKRISH